MTTYAERFDAIAAAFSQRADETPPDAWDRPSPCEGWVARDVIGHLAEWVPGFLTHFVGVELSALPSVEEDPAATWRALRSQLFGLMTDPDSATTVVAGPMGSTTVDALVDQFVTNDVFVHTWDLARAVGLDETLDAAEAERMLAGSEPHDEALRTSGHYGARVELPDDSDVQSRLLAFMGRDPR